MTDSSPYIDPRALEVLHEVAHDPNSTLLRTKRPRAFAAQLGSAPAELARAVAGSTSAEKELLRVYREETAYLLRLAYFERSQRPRPEKEKGLILFRERDREGELGDEAIGRRVADLGEWVTDDGVPSVESALAALTYPQTSLLSLACLSQRFAPSTSALSYIADEHLLAEEGASALVVCKRGLLQPMTAAWRSILTGKLSAACSLLGDYPAAMACQRQDALESPPDLTSSLNWALQAVKCADRASAAEALRFLDTHWGARNAELTQWIELSTLQVQQMPSTLNREALLLARSLFSSAGEVGASLLQFMLQGATNTELT